MKYIFSVIALFISIISIAQTEKEYYDNGNLKSEGKIKTYKQKGQYTVMSHTLKRGEWKYYYEDGTLAKIENYKIKNRQIFNIGNWQFFDPDGRLIYIKNMADSKLNQLLDTGKFVWLEDYIEIKQVSEDTLFYNEYVGQKESKGLYVINQKSFAYLSTAIDTFSFQSVKNIYKGVELLDFDNPKSMNDYLNRIPPYEKMEIDASLNFIQNYQFNTRPERHDIKNKYLGFTPKYWSSAGGTPDYLEEIEDFNIDNPALAFRVFTSVDNDIEYIQTDLKRPLEKGKNYCLKFQLLLSPKSKFATTQIGTSFTDYQIMIQGRSKTIQKAHIYNHKEAIYASSKEWMTWCSPYTAKGGENNLAIGSFQSIYEQKMYLLDINKPRNEAYYFIDDVYLFEIDESHPCSCFNPEENTDTFHVGSSFILRNIFFEIDKAILKEISNIELDKLYKILMDYPTMKIEISGHTDNTGTDERNDILSLERAEAVRNYLIEKNIDASRLTYSGYGSKKPIDTNDTPEGKQNNRRVEFKITEK